MTDVVQVTQRLLDSMASHPEMWKIFRLDHRLWLRHETARIDVAVEGSYWVDINDNDTLKKDGAPLRLGWWF